MIKIAARPLGIRIAPPMLHDQRPSVPYASLPPDMQVLIDDFIQGGIGGRIVPALLPLIQVEVETIPIVPLDAFDRGLDYAVRMDLDKAPPIIVAEGHFMDGKHRAHAARTADRRSLPAIDLSGLVDPWMLECNSMGRLLRPDAEARDEAAPKSQRPGP